MKGLIYKDLVAFKKEYKSLLPALIILIGISAVNKSGSMILGMMIGIALLLVITMFSYDNLYNWTGYSLCFPLSKGEVVLSRYISSAIVSGVFMIFGLVVTLLMNLIFKSTDKILFLEFILIFDACIGLLIVLIPIIIKYGVEKSRFIFIGIAAVGAGSVSVIYSISKIFQVNLSETGTAIVITTLIVIASIISFKFSVKILEKKDW